MASGGALGYGAAGRAARALWRGARLSGLLLLGRGAAAADAPLPPAASAPNPEAHARAVQLHEDAEGALAAADWLTACQLYEASQALDPSATTQGRIAQCLEHDGKLAGALRAYEQALRLVPKLDEPRRQLAAERLPRYISELEPRVPRLTLRVAPELVNAEIRFDGVVLGQAELDVALQVDPGSHVIAVTATGFLEQGCVLQPSEAARLEVRVEARRAVDSTPDADVGCQSLGAAVVRISLSASAPAVLDPPGSSSTSARSSSLQPAAVLGAGEPAPLSLASSAPGLPDAGIPDRPAGRASLQRTLGYTLGGVGTAGLALAAYFGIRTLVLVGRADCDARRECSPRGVTTMQDAEQSQTAGFVAGGVGAALIGGGLALLLVPLSAAPAGDTAAVALGLARGGIRMKAIW
jgi:hypothetical protein